MLRGDKRSMSPCKHVYYRKTSLHSEMHRSKVKASLSASVLFLKLSVNLHSLHRFHHLTALTDLISMTSSHKNFPAVQNGNFFHSRQLKFIRVTLNQRTTDIPGICSYPISKPFPSPSVRWSSHPWTRRATPTCRGLWSRVRRPREESTPSTRPLFSNIDPPCPLLCVCAFQRLPFYWGPAPELGTSDARGRVTSPAEKNETSRPAPVSWAWPLHDDVWRCTLSAFVSAPPSGSPPPPVHPACKAGACLLNPRLRCASASTCRGKWPRYHQRAAKRSVVLLLVLFSSFWRVQPFSFVSLLFSPACLHPSLFSAFQTLLSTWDQISAQLWQCFNCPRVQTGCWKWGMLSKGRGIFQMKQERWCSTYLQECILVLFFRLVGSNLQQDIGNWFCLGFFKAQNFPLILILLYLGEKHRFSMWLVDAWWPVWICWAGGPVDRRGVRALWISDVISFAGQWRTLMSITVECKECSQP